jgi:hypothetical protein
MSKKMMTRLLSIAAVLVATSVTGMAWIGHQAEQYMTSQTRDLLQKWDPVIRLNDLKYKKTFSEATRTLDLQIGCGSMTLPITWQDRIQFGPVPAGKTLGLALIQSDLLLSPDTKVTLKNQLGIEIPSFHIETLLGLGGGISSTLNIPAFKKTSQHPFGLDIDGADMTLKMQHRGTRWRFNGKVPSFTLSMPQEGEFIKLRNYRFESDAKMKTYDWVADHSSDSAELDALDIQAAGTEGIHWAFHHLKLHSQFQVNSGLLSGEKTLTGQAQLNDQKLEKIDLKAFIKRLHAPTVDKVMGTWLNRDTLVGLCRDWETNPSSAGQRFDILVRDSLPQLAQLLIHNPEYVDHLGATYQGVQGSLGYSLGVEGFTADKPPLHNHNPTTDGESSILAALPQKAVASGYVRLPASWVNTLPAVFEKDPQKAHALQTELSAMLDHLKTQGFLKSELGVWTLDWLFRKGQLTANGKTVFSFDNAEIPAQSKEKASPSDRPSNPSSPNRHP